MRGSARHRDADIYHRYAVGLYRQALFGALASVRARVPELRPRDTTSLVHAVLRRLTTSLAAAGPDGAQVIAGRAALPDDEQNVTAR